MTAQIAAATTANIVPAYSPIGTDTIIRDLDEAAYRAGVMIYGDAYTGRTSRALCLLEKRLKSGEQCIAFMYNKRAFRLNEKRGSTPGQPVASGYSLHTFGGKRGKEAHGFALLPEDGGIFGTILALSGDSCAFDFSCFDYDQVTTFLQAFLGTFMTTATRPATILIDDFNVSISRRRGGGDSQALKNFHSLVVRGHNDGIKFIGVSTSPGEVPLEGRNEVTTSILTGTKTQPHLLQLGPVIGANIVTFAKFGGLGISKQEAGHHWLKMPTERNDDLYYLERLEFETGAGNHQPIAKDFDTPGMGAVMTKVKAARSSKGKPGKVGKKQKKTKNSGSADTGSVTIDQVYGILQANSLPNSIAHATIARLVVAVETGCDLDRKFRMDPALVLAKSLDEPRLVQVTKWRNTRANGISKIVSSSFAAALMIQMARVDEKQAYAFMDQMAGRTERGAIAQSLVSALMKLPVSRAPLVGTARMKLIMDAWSEHLAEVTPQGQVVQLRTTQGVRKAA